MVAPSSLRRRISCGDELHLLGHALGEFFHLLVPPVGNVKADKPLLEFHGGFAGAHALELGQVHGLLPYLHLAVQAAFLGQVADAGDIGLRNRVSVEPDLAFAGEGDAVNDADEGTLTRSVGAQKAEYLSLRNLQRDMVQGHFLTESFG